MPVKSETDLPAMYNILDEFLMGMDNGGCDPFMYPNTEPLLSDDIWKKFDLPDLGDIVDDLEATTRLDSTTFGMMEELRDVCEIRHHDCMWAGHCGSEEHPVDEPRSSLNFFPIMTPAALCGSNTVAGGGQKTPALNNTPPPPPVQHQQQQQQQSIRQCPPPPQQQQTQQSLLKTNIRLNNNTLQLPNMMHTPQTPPMSDDEEAKSNKPTKVLQILQETIRNFDIDQHLDEDSDLCDYLNEGEDIDAVDVDDEEDDEEEEEEEELKKEQDDDEEERIRFYQCAAENDHSYHKDKNASMRMANNLGIDTPSDSEDEEIDVVSVTEKLNSRIVTTLPTNPSTRDRQQLEGRITTAMTRKRMTATTTNLSNISNIKTVLPLVKRQTESTATVKRRTIGETRGVKRSRQYRMANGGSNSSSNNNSPYKRRAVYGNSSDSEPEPSEKRSLHNNMERQRRIDLRNAFEDLRILVPEVSKKERAPKVVILREAAQYCRNLGNISNNQTAHLDELRRKQEWLRQRVSQLRRSLAAKR